MSEQNLDELKQRLEHAETPLEFRRVQCVYLKENYGYSSQQIAEMTNFSPGNCAGESKVNIVKMGWRHCLPNLKEVDIIKT